MLVKQKFLFLIGVLFFLESPYALAANLSQSENIFYGTPTCSGEILERVGYVLCYDKETKNATWSSHHLKSSYLGKVKRTDDFRPDSELPKGERAELKDYRKSGYDMGHLVPAQDMSRSKKAMSESFLLSNMCPQVGVGFNRGIWKQLEADVRKWAKAKKSIYIFSGPLYLDEQGNRVMHYNNVLQPDKVAIPTHFYKIVVAERPNHELDAIAFVLPNKASPVSKLPTFITSIDNIEKDSGVDFLEDLEDSKENKLESKIASSLW